ncbi:hypothetical protein BJX66DRAFT_345144 [Aspergillus keveii]|uniref:Zn(2)-C6 fungal-type domain-containing protein n=1 Tax=Aspergillus keveii TaxID=714993 RepID=A0ABR4FIZ6_9EURO
MATPQKQRTRLATACDHCRNHKVRCDTSPGSCRPCRKKGYQCITTDCKTGYIISRKGSRRAERRVDDGLGTTTPATPSSADMGTFDIPTDSPDTETTGHVSSLITGRKMQPTTGGWAAREGSFQEESLVYNADCNGRVAVLGGSNMQILVANWIDKYFERHRLEYRLADSFKHGLRHAVEGPSLVTAGGAAAPLLALSEDVRRAYVDAYFTRIHPIFPVLEELTFRESLIHIDLDCGSNVTTDETLPAVAIALSVFGLGCDCLGKRITSDGTLFLQQAYSLLPNIMGFPFIRSVQALIVLTISLRSRGRDGQSSLTIALAIRMAQSLGLQYPSRLAKTPLDAVIWNALLCLDTISSMESGKARVIRDGEFDQQPNTAPSRSPNTPGWEQYSPYFTSLTSLCGITSRLRVTGRLSMVGNVHENRERTLDRCIKLNETLRAWYSGLSADIDTSQQKSATRYFSCYIMSLYHQTVIWTNWVSLVTHPEAYESEIARHHSLDSPNYRQLLSGESQCLSSATEIVKIVTELAENEQPIGLIPVSRLSFAAVVLTVLLLKNPSNALSSVYLMYLHLACNIAADLYDRIGQDKTFANSWRIWFSFIDKHIRARLSVSEDSLEWATFLGLQKRVTHEETSTAATPRVCATPTLSHNELLGAGGLGLLEHITAFPEGSCNFGSEWDDAFWLNFTT